ncbi:ABC transporter substrate-binding protein [Bifidobacterium ramosum]|uniref:ABC transporter substrate-binding protein n=1 Tax=Bifidobacterium ramosum TaxID=1798158 RepID=A0A6L4WYL6_9BIFI|nr:ABC transporter substrate-binding protein [Bifidobacterium ramosum]
MPAAPGKTAVWDGSTNEYENMKAAVSANAKNKDAALKVVDLLYSEKYSVQQFAGSFGDTLTQDGDHTYTEDSKKMQDLKADNKMPALADRLAGWIPDDVTINDDYDAADIQEVNKAFEEQRANYDHVKDYIPDYVRADATDSTTLSNNNTQILNFALQKTAQWMVKGGIDNEWDDYVKQLDTLGLQDNIKIWQKWYDTYTK